MSIGILCVSGSPIVMVSKSSKYCNLHSVLNYHCHIFRNKVILILLILLTTIKKDELRLILWYYSGIRVPSEKKCL